MKSEGTGSKRQTRNTSKVIGDTSFVKFVVKRGIESSLKLFTENGITREHSISYQEYNHTVITHFFKAAAEHLSDDNGKMLENVVSQTPIFLSAFTRQNGEFFALGDSFRQPGRHVVGEGKVNEYANNSWIYCKDGFFSYKSERKERKIHFVATCSWHSGNHKQDDDTSFCLEVDEKMIFDDPGYTDHSQVDVSHTLTTEWSHSLVTLNELPFSARTETNGGSKITGWEKTMGGFVVDAEHRRIPDTLIKRKFVLHESVIDIADSIETRLTGTCQHAFILSPDVQVVDAGDVVHLLRDGVIMITLMALSKDGLWTQSWINYIGSDKRIMDKTLRLSYKAPIVSQRRFRIKIVG